MARVHRFVLAPTAACVLGVLGLLPPGVASAIDVDYVEHRAEYARAPRQLVPADARTYSVVVPPDVGIDPEALVIRGFERVADEADLVVRVTAKPAVLSDAKLQMFAGQVFTQVNGQPSSPFFDYTIYWYDVTVAQEAEVTVEGTDAPPFSSGAIGAVVSDSLGKPSQISTGVFQACAGPRCVMKNEPAGSPDTAAKRAQYLLETFATDLRRDGYAVIAADGRARADQGLAAIRARLEAEPGNPFSAQTTERITAWLEQQYGRGAREMTVPLATSKDDARFARALATLGEGSGEDVDERRRAAVAEWRAIADDPAVEARGRAAALYNVAVIEGLLGDIDAATQDLAAAARVNAEQKDRMLGRKHGKALDERIGAFRAKLAERGPAPAP
jgi:hypothetical protein